MNRIKETVFVLTVNNRSECYHLGKDYNDSENLKR